MSILILGAAALVGGFACVLLAMAPSWQGGRLGSLPHRALRMRCLLGAGLLTALGGLHQLAVRLEEPAAKARALADAQLLLEEPLGVLSMQAEGDNPFAGAGPGFQLRLLWVLTDGLEVVCDIPGEGLQPDQDIRANRLAWAALLRGANAPTLAARLVRLNDLRLVERLEVTLTGQPGQALPRGVTLQVIPEGRGAIRLFDGRSAAPSEQDGAPVATYRDEQPPGMRLRQTWRAALEAPAEGLDPFFRVCLGAAVFLLLIGAAHLLGPRASDGLGSGQPATRWGGASQGAAWFSVVFVWGIWAAAFAAALFLSGRYGLKYPYVDDWDCFVPVLTGSRPFTLDWLWEPHNEHRIVLPKLLWLGLYKLSGLDLRAGVLFNALCLGVLAAAMIATARRLRGRTVWTDAFFPLVMLHWGHLAFWWGFEAQFLSSVFLAGLFLVGVVAWTKERSLWAGVLAGVCLLLLPWTGANGIALVPALALWFLYGAARAWGAGSARGRGQGVLFLGFALASLLCVVLVLSGQQVGASAAASKDLLSLATSSSRFLSAGFARANLYFWPYSGVLVVGLFVLSAVVLLRRFPGAGDDRPRVLGLLLFLGGAGCLMLALGWGRGGYPWEPGWTDTHYAVLTIPVLCCVYLTWELYGAPTGRRLAQTSLLLVTGVSFAVNASNMHLHTYFLQIQQAFEQDLLAGTPTVALVDKHIHLFWAPHELYPQEMERGRTVVAEGLRSLRQAGVEPFRRLRD